MTKERKKYKKTRYKIKDSLPPFIFLLILFQFAAPPVNFFA